MTTVDGYNQMKTFLATMLLAVMANMLPPVYAGTDSAAELKDAQAALSAGDYKEAYPQYLRFANEDNALAQFTVGMFHQLGWGNRSVDPVAACQWFEKSAAGDIPTASHYLAECFERGIGRPANPAKAARWYQQAAGLGHYQSLCSLAELYMKGEGVAKDPQKGLELCKQAAEKGAVLARLQVGRYLLQGDRSIRDPQAAHDWFELASAASAEAQYYLGIMHRDGIGHEATPDEARVWFERAASTGYVPAYFHTARLYFEASPDYQSQPPGADDLARAYMWLSATAQRSQDPVELQQTQEMLKQVLAIMPASWVATLDKRVVAHLSEHPAAP